MTDPFADYPVVVDVPVAWGEQDAFGHVNNIVYLRWFENARIRYFAEIGWMADGRQGATVPILARTQAVFRSPVVYPDTVRVGARTTSLGLDRFTMAYRVWSDAQDREVALGDARVVCVRVDGGGKAPLPDAVAARIVALAGADLVMEPTP